MPEVVGSIVITRLDPKTPRKERIQRLLQYYLDVLVEDPVDGTNFDCDILDFFRDLEEKYKNDQ